jgi:peroxiredoxin
MFKKIFTLIFTLSILNGCQKEQKNLYKITKLQDGFPEILTPFKKDLPFKILTHSILKSTNDSIDIYFGGLKQGNRSGHWIAIAVNDHIKEFSSVSFNENPENEKENDIDIKFNNSTNRVSLRIKEVDTIANKITYSWMNQSNLTDSLTVQKIDRPLINGKTFPEIELTNMDGEKLNLDKFKEQTIVINWWAVWCAPCREEIPGLNKLVDKYSDKNVKFISITNDDVDKVSEFLENHEFKYDITFVSNNSEKIFGNSYPKNIVIDKDNTITFYEEGGDALKWQKIDKHLTELKL